MMTRAVLAVFGLFLLYAGCSALKVSTREMTPGEKLFRANCRACHTLPRVGSRSQAEWRALIGQHQDRLQLQEADVAAIINYLQKADQDTAETSRTNE